MVIVAARLDPVLMLEAMKRIDDKASRTEVKFIVGHGKTDTSKTWLSRIKEEFDRNVEVQSD